LNFYTFYGQSSINFSTQEKTKRAFMSIIRRRILSCSLTQNFQTEIKLENMRWIGKEI